MKPPALLRHNMIRVTPVDVDMRQDTRYTPYALASWRVILVVFATAAEFYSAGRLPDARSVLCRVAVSLPFMPPALALSYAPDRNIMSAFVYAAGFAFAFATPLPSRRRIPSDDICRSTITHRYATFQIRFTLTSRYVDEYQRSLSMRVTPYGIVTFTGDEQRHILI